MTMEREKAIAAAGTPSDILPSEESYHPSFQCCVCLAFQAALNYASKGKPETRSMLISLAAKPLLIFDNKI